MARRFRCGGIFNDFFHYTFTAESDSERNLKIGQHLSRLWAITYRVVFFMKHGVHDIKYRKDVIFLSLVSSL